MNANTKKSGAGKWLVLGGCGCVLIGLLGCGGFVGLVFGGVRTMMMKSESYEQAMEALSESQEAEDAVGAPFEPGWFFTGSVNVSNGLEAADYSFPVSGPNGSGRVTVRGTCERGECDFQRLELEAKGQRYDLTYD